MLVLDWFGYLSSGVTEVLVMELEDQITWAGYCCIF